MKSSRDHGEQPGYSSSLVQHLPNGICRHCSTGHWQGKIDAAQAENCCVLSKALLINSMVKDHLSLYSDTGGHTIKKRRHLGSGEQ